MNGSELLHVLFEYFLRNIPSHIPHEQRSVLLAVRGIIWALRFLLSLLILPVTLCFFAPLPFDLLLCLFFGWGLLRVLDGINLLLLFFLFCRFSNDDLILFLD